MLEFKKFRLLPVEYTSFRKKIIEYFFENLFGSKKIILDPMAGTAPLIPYVASSGIYAYFNDINPVHYYINSAKTYQVYKTFNKISFKKKFSLYKELLLCLKKIKNKSLIISDKWIPDEILEGFLYGWEKTENYEWEISLIIKTIILLSIRPYSSITKCEKNMTWISPGGMTTHLPLSNIIKNNLSKLTAYYEYYYSKVNYKSPGICAFSIEDAKFFNAPKKVDVILTSPPYANRYDFTRTFGPELYFLDKTGDMENLGGLKNEILASNVVKDYKTYESDLQKISKLAPKTCSFIYEIRKKEGKGESDYYARYFAKYYINLFETLSKLTKLLLKTGCMFLVVQNNVHRAELNAMDDFISEYFINSGYKVSIELTFAHAHQGRRNISANHPLVIKKHIETIMKINK